DVHDGDVRLALGDEVQGLGDVLRLAADLKVGLPRDPQGQPFADNRVVIHDQDSGELLGYSALGHWSCPPATGTVVQFTTVPPPSAGSTRSVAPIRAARYCMIFRPMPRDLGGGVGMPTPSSRIVRVSQRSFVARLMPMWVAWPWVRALVIASWAMRNRWL